MRVRLRWASAASARRTGDGYSSWPSLSGLLGPAAFPRGGRTHGNGGSMKKKASRPRGNAVRDTMRTPVLRQKRRRRSA